MYCSEMTIHSLFDIFIIMTYNEYVNILMPYQEIISPFITRDYAGKTNEEEHLKMGFIYLYILSLL